MAQKLDSNNLVAKPETTLNYIMHPDDLQNHTSSPSNDDVNSDEPNNSQAALQDGSDDEPVNSSGGSVGGKKQVKKFLACTLTKTTSRAKRLQADSI